MSSASIRATTSWVQADRPHWRAWASPTLCLSRSRRTGTGLVETVVTRAPVDEAQVALIRHHLAAEAAAFRAGDFSDPAKIHGDDMPGLAALSARADQLTVAYQDLDAGGRITYGSTDPAVVTALHDFGHAQAGDHDHG